MTLHEASVIVGVIMIVPACVTLTVVWLSRRAPWMIAIFGLVAVVSLVGMIANAIVARIGHYAPPLQLWLMGLFTVSLAMTFFTAWALSLDD